MSQELILVFEPALTLTAKLMQADVQRAAGIVMTESATAGLYTGNVPPGTAAGLYQVLVYEGATVVATGDLRWDGTAEVQPGGAGTNGADPWLTTLPGSYAAGTAGAAVGKLNLVGTASTPVMPVPQPAADNSVCRMYGYFENLGNRPAALKVTFSLLGPVGLRSERLIVSRKLEVSTNASGALTDGTNPWVELQRTDLIQPAGAVYEVTCLALGISRKRFALTTATADLALLLAN